MEEINPQIKKFIDDGRNLVNNGQAHKAVVMYQEAVKTAEKLNEKKWIGYFLQQQGVAFQTLQKFPEATEVITKAIGVFDKDDSVNLGAAYRDLGLVKIHEEKFGDAIAPLEKSIAILSRYGKDFNSWGVSLGKLGVAYTGTKQYGLAREKFEEALIVMRRQGDWFMEMTTLLGFANLDFQEKRLREMIDKLWAALGMIYEKGDYGIQKRRLVEIYGLLAKGYEATGATEMVERLRDKARGFLKEMPEEVKQDLEKTLQINA